MNIIKKLKYIRDICYNKSHINNYTRITLIHLELSNLIEKLESVKENE